MPVEHDVAFIGHSRDYFALHLDQIGRARQGREINPAHPCLAQGRAVWIGDVARHFGQVAKNQRARGQGKTIDRHDRVQGVAIGVGAVACVERHVVAHRRRPDIPEAGPGEGGRHRSRFPGLGGGILVVTRHRSAHAENGLGIGQVVVGRRSLGVSGEKEAEENGGQAQRSKELGNPARTGRRAIGRISWIGQIGRINGTSGAGWPAFPGGAP